jgi:hypothetical protein
LVNACGERDDGHAPRTFSPGRAQGQSDIYSVRHKMFPYRAVVYAIVSIAPEFISNVRGVDAICIGGRRRECGSFASR